MRSIHSKSAAIYGFLTILGLGLPAARASSSECSTPNWVKLVELRKKSDELIATGSGDTPAVAYIAAKRKMASEFVEQYANDLLKLPQLKGRLNTKAYAKSDITKALKPAVAFNITNPKRLEYEPRCELVYIALSAIKKDVIAQIKAETDFADHINAALTGKIDQLEAAAFKKDNQNDHQELSDAEKLIASLNETSALLDSDDFLEKDMVQLIKIKQNALKKASDNLNSITFRADRDKEIARFKNQILDAGRIQTAIKDFKKKEYISAIEIFQKCAQSNDAICQFIVGNMHLRALGTKKNMDESLKWLKKSAENNHTLAKLFLGIYTFAGIGTQADPQLATKWINQAFNEGWTCDIEFKACSKGK